MAEFGPKEFCVWFLLMVYALATVLLLCLFGLDKGDEEQFGVGFYIALGMLGLLIIGVAVYFIWKLLCNQYESKEKRCVCVPQNIGEQFHKESISENIFSNNKQSHGTNLQAYSTSKRFTVTGSIKGLLKKLFLINDQNKGHLLTEGNCDSAAGYDVMGV